MRSQQTVKAKKNNQEKNPETRGSNFAASETEDCFIIIVEMLFDDDDEADSSEEEDEEEEYGIVEGNYNYAELLQKAMGEDEYP
ncbi:hypothetical protein PsorP6_016403 [Peronosclerospora sorghi]|uniref:Uncharacterized protein n=1 Tax=Peronosclerospora sorghi TaxID=230839 RepID=A0ACC0VNL1_9STRA|nr:hypothetical protein PsorP6_016403 [Peronosclerospora sorghi]